MEGKSKKRKEKREREEVGLRTVRRTWSEEEEGMIEIWEGRISDTETCEDVEGNVTS